MKDLIAGLIHSANGYSYETVGVLIGFFKSSEQAHRCAKDFALASVGVQDSSCTYFQWLTTGAR